MRCTDDWAVEDHSENEAFAIYPNPTSDKVWVEGFRAETEIRVCDMCGRCLMTTREPSVDISSFAPGIYLLEIRCDGQAPVSRKVIRK